MRVGFEQNFFLNHAKNTSRKFTKFCAVLLPLKKRTCYQALALSRLNSATISYFCTMQIQRIALAIAFSPRLEANLAEASRLNTLFQSHLFLIHVGTCTSADEEELHSLMNRYALNSNNCTICWQQGETVDTILDTCKAQQVDLLITGALEKEGLLQYYLGSVARQLSRKAQCSVLMLTEPSTHPIPFRNIVVSNNDQEELTTVTLEIAVKFAQLEKADLNIIHEADYHRMAQLGSEAKSFDEISSIKNTLIEEDREKLNRLLSCTDCAQVHVNTLNLEGKPGVAISNYAREHQADLLILPAPEKRLGLFDRVFQHDIEYVLAHLPCNLLIVHHQHHN